MRTPLAWHNLVHNKVRTVVGVAGVTFAVVLIFMQLGFLGSIETTVTMVYDALDFQLLVRSPRYRRFNDPRTFPQQRLYQVAGSRDVRAVVPLDVALNAWQNPITLRRRGILMLGVRPGDQAFAVPEIQEKSRLLTDPQFVLVDRKSRREFGPKNGWRFSDADIGTAVEVNGYRVEIVGHFPLGTGLAADGSMLLSADGFCRVLPGRAASDVSLGLVQLRDGADPDAAAAALRDLLPQDVDVLTRDQAVQKEREGWIKDSSIGLIFQLGVGMSLLVGVAIVYQVLYSEVANHMSEYATLKAMGYTVRRLAGVVLGQALGLALAGFCCGLALSVLLYRGISAYANLPIEMNAGRALLVLALTAAMCTVSGLGALRKMATADPADLF